MGAHATESGAKGVFGATCLARKTRAWLPHGAVEPSSALLSGSRTRRLAGPEALASAFEEGKSFICVFGQRGDRRLGSDLRPDPGSGRDSRGVSTGAPWTAAPALPGGFRLPVLVSPGLWFCGWGS